MLDWFWRRHDHWYIPDVPGRFQLVVACHGYGMWPPLYQWGSGLDDIGRWFTAAGQPTIVYYPAGRWRNWGRGIYPWREPHSTVPYMERLLEQVTERYEITDIFLAGFSKGAIFAGFFARYCDPVWRPKAVVIYAGGHIGDRVVPEKYDVMLIRGADDHMVPRGYDPQRALTEAERWYREHGHPITVLEPEEGRHEWDEKVNPKVYEFLRSAGQPRLGNVDEAIRELREAGLNAWDDIEDPYEFLRGD